MVRTKDGDGIKSFMIVAEVQKRACLYDTNDAYYGDKLRKERCWYEVCECVVPGWEVLRPPQKKEAVREVQKRWRSIRDSYTKAYRQGKCVLPEQCQPGSRRHQYHTQMSFLLRALQNKKPRYSQDKLNSSLTSSECPPEKYESFSEVSNSPQHPPPEDLPRPEPEKPLDLKTKIEVPEKPETVDKCNQAAMSQDKPIEINNPSVEIKIDANSILPDDYFDDDRMFMNSLLPLFKKMSDDTRLLCRIEVLKIIRLLLRGEGRPETPLVTSTGLVHKIDTKEELTPGNNARNSTLAVTTRSAGGTRPQRKRKTRSPSPLPYPTKRRGPGRPRKVRPPPSDSEEDHQIIKKRCPKLKVSPDILPEDDISTVTSVTQLTQPLFMKMYNLERSKIAQDLPQSVQVSVKTEPVDDPHMTTS